MRVLVATTVAVCLLAAGPAAASPSGDARFCDLVKDPRGDVDPGLVDTRIRSSPPSDALDILGGDIAADDRTVTVVVRLRSPAAADTYSPGGYSYDFLFTVGTGETPDRFTMSADIGADAQSYTLSREDQTGAGLGVYIRGVVDAERREVRMSADMAQLAALAQGDLSRPRGRALYDLALSSGTLNGDPRAAMVTAMGADVASTARGTSIGAASCVRVGA